MPKGREAELVGLESDVAHVREILRKVRDPQHRYQLTMLLEIAAQQVIRLENADTETKKERKYESHPRATP